jgi:hypothetical protein
MGLKACQVQSRGIRPLNKHEIDRRIELLVTEVAARAQRGKEGEAFRPRWISAGELVRLMQPFIVRN